MKKRRALLLTFLILLLIVSIPSQGGETSQRQKQLDGTLIKAIMLDDTSGVLAALKAGAAPDLPGDHRRTPLMQSIRYSSPAVVRLMLPHCHRINARDDQGWTALHYVMREYRPNILALLLAGKVK